MKREDALVIAERSADVAWRVLKAPKSFGWVETLDPPGGLVDLCRWVEANADRTAPDLYYYAMRLNSRPAPWLGIPRELRTAIEIFRATYVVMLSEVHLTDVNRRRGQQGACATHGRAANVVLFPRGGGDAA